MSKSQVGLTKPSPSIGRSQFSSNGTTAVHLFIKRSSHNQRSKFYLSQREPESHEKGNGLWILCLSLIIVCTFRRVLFCLSLSELSLLDRRRSSIFIHGFEADLEGAQGPPERPSYLLQCWYRLLRQTPLLLLFYFFPRCLFLRFSLVSMAVSFFPGSICDLSNFWGSGLYFLIKICIFCYTWGQLPGFTCNSYGLYVIFNVCFGSVWNWGNVIAWACSL